MTSKTALIKLTYGSSLPTQEIMAYRKIIESELEILEIIQNHKLLNYVIKNRKCANMYKLTDYEFNKLEEFSNGTK